MEKNVMNWKLDETGKLTISGEGKIYDQIRKEKAFRRLQKNESGRAKDNLS